MPVGRLSIVGAHGILQLALDVARAASLRPDVAHAASLRPDVAHAASLRPDVAHAASLRLIEKRTSERKLAACATSTLH